MKNNTQTELNKRISELETNNDNLRLLATRISLMDEKERIKIAAEIHDGIGQNLVLCNINLVRLIMSSKSVELTKSLKEIQTIIKRILDETRSIIFDISPPSLNQIGLEPALEELISRTGKKHHFKTTFKGDGRSGSLNKDVHFLLFQMVRELLANISKHAHAQNVRVSVSEHENTIQIRVTDDGRGFDPKMLDHKDAQGLGLFKISEQLSQIGGSLEIKSKRGGGTITTLTAPLVI